MNTAKIVVKTIDYISEKVGHITSYTMLVLIVSASIEIVCRYFFNRPTIWAYELGQMIFGSYFLLAGAMALRNREHVGMEMVLDKLSPRGQAIMNSITFVFVALFCTVLLWKGWEFAYASIKRLEHSTSVWGPPIFIYKTMLPLSALLMLAQGISNFIKDLYFAISGRRLIEE